MKDLNECKAEIFRRSENRIKARRRAYNRIFALCIPAVVIIAFLPILVPMHSNNTESEGAYHETTDNVTDRNISYYSEESKKPGGVSGEEADLESEWSNTSAVDGPSGRPSASTSTETNTVWYNDFSFSLEWGVYQQCSYDSETGRLVKYNDLSEPDKYATYYQLTDNQLNKLNLMMCEMDIQSYPRTYSPYGDGVVSTPSDNLILTVRAKGFEKTVYALNIPVGIKAEDAKGQKFIDVCEEIKEIIFNSEEWKSLPEPELEPLI